MRPMTKAAPTITRMYMNANALSPRPVKCTSMVVSTRSLPTCSAASVHTFCAYLSTSANAMVSA